MIKLKYKIKYNKTLNFLCKRNLTKGYTIVEMILYLAIFVSLSVLVINSFIIILSSFNATIINHKLLESGSVAMERISMEIRQAKNIDIMNSSFDTDPGILQLNTVDDGGDSTITKFITEDQKFYLYKDGALVDGLLGENIFITNLTFNRISTTNSEAVKIEMSLQYLENKNTKTEKFYNTIILRGGY